MYGGCKRKWYKKGKELLEEIAGTDLPENEAAVWYIGQCGFVVKKRSIIYVDPVLNDIWDENGNTVRLYEPPYSPDSASADYVLCTHAHIDHMAVETIRGICGNNPQVLLVVPGVCREILLAEGIAEERIVEAVSEKKICLPGVEIIPFSTAHPRHEVGEDGRESSLAYYVNCEQISFLHMGDTFLTERLTRNLKKYPGPDILMVPVNGSDFYLERKDIIGNMSAREAAKFSKELGADLVIPMHFDMIDGNTVNPTDFIEELWHVDSGMKFSIPALGERIIYRRRERHGNHCL